jgi:lysyl-tRNA synthetase class 2
MKPEQKKLELSDNEKEIFEILKTQKSMNLNDLKTQSGLSNKGWDKGMKGLAKQGLTKVTKTDDALIVELQE